MMEAILDKDMFLDGIFAFGFTMLFAFGGALSNWMFVAAYVATYGVYIGLTFGLKTLNIDIF